MFYECFHFLPMNKYREKNLLRKACTNIEYNYLRLDYRGVTRENKHYFFEKETIFPLKRIPFGVGTYPVPRKTLDYLRVQYHQPVKYPPLENQKPTHLVSYKNLKNERMN